MSRRKKLVNDLEVAQKEYDKKNSLIKDIRLEDESLFFSYDSGRNNKENFVLHLNDYPDSCLLFFGSQSRMCTGTLLSIMKEVVSEYNEKFKIKPLKQSVSSVEDDNEDYLDDEDEDLGRSGGWGVESGEYDDLKDVYEQEMAYEEHKDLTLEIKNYKALFGDNTVSTKPMPLLETVDIEAVVPYADVIEETVCNAWGVDPRLPIVLKVTASSDYYLDAQKEPKIEFYQLFEGVASKEKRKFRLKYQLESIVTQYIRDIWPANSNKKIKTLEYQSKSNSNISNNNNNNEKSKMGQKQGSGGGILSKVFGTKKINDHDISQLVDMGFSVEMARNALRMTSSLEEATNLLLTNPDNCMENAQVEERKPDNNKPNQPRQIGRVDELFKSPDKALSNDSKKVIIDTKYGFLPTVVMYIRYRLPTLNNYCVICDQPHVFATGNMLKPAVCTRELCCFSFQQLGVAGDAADDIATAAEVVDLLVSFATLSAKSPRNTLIFDPYPTIFDPKNPKIPILSPNNKDLAKVNLILSRFPSVEKMSQAKDFTDMKKQMDKAHEHAFALLQWIITSNRSHIVKLNPDKYIKSMETPHQYLLLSAPPEKEAKFRELKQKHGSTFAFHGSSSENWHSILRQGLKNASGTKLQMNGAAYGQGIYLSPHAGTSFGYSRMYGYGGNQAQSSSGGNRFLSNDNIYCIAICEVIDKDIRKSGSIWVQPHEDYVVTRFFFVYTGVNPGSAVNNNSEDSKFRNEILHAINY